MTITLAEARTAGYDIVRSNEGHGDRWYIDQAGGPAYRDRSFATRSDALRRVAQHLENQAAATANIDHDIVDVAEIAKRLGMTAGAVHQLRRRHADFPVPAATLAVGPVWYWPGVERWAAVPRPAGRPRKV